MSEDPLDGVIVDDADLDAIIEDELAGEAAQADPAGFGDNIVVLAGREFEIGEPSIGIVLRIVNIIGRLGTRGERVATRALADVAREIAAGNRTGLSMSFRVVVFGMLASAQEADLHALGSAVLQFENDKEGRQWLADLGQEFKLAPLIKAFFINLAQSEDLVEALENFFVGLGMVEARYSRVGAMIS